jgi:hypothetical protein
MARVLRLAKRVTALAIQFNNSLGDTVLCFSSKLVIDNSYENMQRWEPRQA